MIYKDEAAAKAAANMLNCDRGFPRAKALLTAGGWTVIQSYRFGVSGPETIKKYSIEAMMSSPSGESWWVPVSLTNQGPQDTEDLGAATLALRNRKELRPESEYRLIEWVGTVIASK